MWPDNTEKRQDRQSSIKRKKIRVKADFSS